MSIKPLSHRARAIMQVMIVLATFSAPVVHAGDPGEGRSLYLRYCASCHGQQADGRGPVAKSLRDQPSDLRKLGEKYGMPLPHGQIARFADGRADVAAHGSREMPVWGERFGDIYTARHSQHGDLPHRIDKIIDYLNSIQTGAHPSETPSAPVGMLAPSKPVGKM
jgi:mono/diheme cytochrome c family protein